MVHTMLQASNFLDPKKNLWIQAIPYMPGFQIFDQVMCVWYDAYVDAALKMYYWPAFVAGNADNWTDLMRMPFKPMCAR